MTSKAISNYLNAAMKTVNRFTSQVIAKKLDLLLQYRAMIYEYSMEYARRRAEKLPEYEPPLHAWVQTISEAEGLQDDIFRELDKLVMYMTKVYETARRMVQQLGSSDARRAAGTMADGFYTASSAAVTRCRDSINRAMG